VYKAVEEFYDEFYIGGTIDYPLIGKLRTATAEGRFLFPTEIKTYLETLKQKATEAAKLQTLLYPASGQEILPALSERRSKVVDQQQKLLDEVRELQEQGRKLFEKHLRLA
jgi:hypothetical protein